MDQNIQNRTFLAPEAIKRLREEPDEEHAFAIERIEDDWCVTLDHPMTKDHYVNFVAYVTSGAMHMRKLYPEQQVEERFHMTGSGTIYLYCNKHGLFRRRTPRRNPAAR